MKDSALLHYRQWTGAFRPPAAAVWPVARVAVRMLFRRRLFWGLFGVGMFFFLMFFFGGLLLDWVIGQMPPEPIKMGRVRINPEQLIREFQKGIDILNGGQFTFGYFFLYQGSIVMVTLALTGAVLVGNDFLFGSVPFYLAKPISRWHYILGKCLAVGVVVNLLTTLPALLLYLRHGLSDWQYLADPDYFRAAGGSGPGGPELLLGVLGYGLLLTVVLSLMLVAVASWVRRTMPLVMVWTTVFLFLRLLSRILVDGLHYDHRWRLIDMWNNLRRVGSAMLQIDPERISPSPQPAAWEAALVLTLVCLLCLSYLNLRTRAVEIVP